MGIFMTPQAVSEISSMEQIMAVGAVGNNVFPLFSWFTCMKGFVTFQAEYLMRSALVSNVRKNCKMAPCTIKVCNRFNFLLVKRWAILFCGDINQRKRAYAQVYDQSASNNIGEKLSSHFVYPSSILMVH
jgi:hypothetical protein